ncbi:MAG TPA: transglycosylase SLT domain-containing protein, partial [Bacteroidota bacterium]|nr:transglycosylase SLT domain-containing protein [Bacteroidota bacterium]
RLQKAVREFESVFVGYLLKSMRNTVQKADNSNDGFGFDILEGMFDLELAKHISRNSHLGLAEMLYRKLTGESLQSRVTAAPAQPASTAVTKRPPVKVERPTTTNETASGWNATLLKDRLRAYEQHISEASEKFGVRDSLIRAVIAAESGARADARSAKDAKGLMQLLDSTAAMMGVRDIWNPRENILGGTKYLKQLLDRFNGDEKLALASYNAGPAAVEKHGGIPPYRETRDYVQRVMTFVEMMDELEDNDE